MPDEATVAQGPLEAWVERNQRSADLHFFTRELDAVRHIAREQDAIRADLLAALEGAKQLIKMLQPGNVYVQPSMTIRVAEVSDMINSTIRRAKGTV
jgi:hypothetical protein